MKWYLHETQVDLQENALNSRTRRHVHVNERICSN